MTILLHNGSNAGVFDRLGEIGGLLFDLVSLKGGATTTNVGSGASILTRYTNFETAFAAAPNFQNVLDGLYSTVTSFQNVFGGLQSDLRTRAQNLLVQQANADTPLAAQTVANALRLLIRQMTDAGASVQSSTISVGAQTASGTPNGNPVLVMTTKAPSGLVNQTTFPETLSCSTSGDSQGSATLGNEPFTVTGAAQVSDMFAATWPGGSGASASFNLADPTKNNTAGNLLVNSGFETFTTTNQPDNWVIATGVVTTDVQSSSTAYSGSKSVKLLGDGATLVAIQQPFNTAVSTSAGAGGTPARLTAGSLYAVSLYYKLSGSSPSTGVLEVALVDGSGTIVQDNASADNKTTVALTGVADTNWHNLTATFRLPAVLPAVLKLRIRQSTALETGKHVFIDHLGMTTMTQVYSGGVYVAGFSDTTKVITGDTWTFAVSATWGKFARLFEQLFGMRGLSLQLPYAGSPTVPDTYIA